MSRILVIDDQKSIRNTLKDILEYEKHEVVLAENGPEGLEKFTADKYDVVLLDIKMPEMDGFEATRQIKSLRNVKIIGQTAYVHDREKQKCTDAGFDEYLSKPITIDHLLHSIEQAFTKN